MRARFGGGRAVIRALPAAATYAADYGRYRKTYHVRLQLESAALRGKPVPRGPALIAAMMMAEFQHLSLTAAHDLDTLEPPVTLTVASGEERYVLLRGEERQVKAGDMMNDRVTGASHATPLLRFVVGYGSESALSGESRNRC